MMLSYSNIKKLFTIISLTLLLPGCCKPSIKSQELSEIDHIVVEKSKKTLSVYKGKQELSRFKVALGRSPKGHKEQEGDHKTPEGTYKIIHKNPESQYHKALTISYPNNDDKTRAAKKGVNPGGEIQIHGFRKDLAWVSQDDELKYATRGCILLTNPELERVYAATKIGTTIEIRP